MMLDRIKAKRDALEKEIAVHNAIVNSLANRIDVLNEIIREEECLNEVAPVEGDKECEKISFGCEETEE